MKLKEGREVTLKDKQSLEEDIDGIRAYITGTDTIKVDGGQFVLHELDASGQLFFILERTTGKDTDYSLYMLACESGDREDFWDDNDWIFEEGQTPKEKSYFDEGDDGECFNDGTEMDYNNLDFAELIQIDEVVYTKLGSLFSKDQNGTFASVTEWEADFALADIECDNPKLIAIEIGEGLCGGLIQLLVGCPVNEFEIETL